MGTQEPLSGETFMVSDVGSYVRTEDVIEHSRPRHAKHVSPIIEHRVKCDISG